MRCRKHLILYLRILSDSNVNWKDSILGNRRYNRNDESKENICNGFNFYNSQYSIKHINPYAVTDAGEAFPSGDAFLVYPGEGGVPEESIRLMLMQQVMQDVRAFELLESLVGRERVCEIIAEGTDEPITFKRYPKEKEWLLALRERVNAEIEKAIAIQ